MSESVSVKKQEMRTLLKEKRKAYPKEKIAYASEIITKKILQHMKEVQYDAVLSYMPLYGEINTEFLHDELLKNKIPIFLPCTEEEIVFYSFTATDSFIKGAFSISEPDRKKEEPLLLDRKKKYLILVPGIGFDEHGGRIGYGKGYYDRFLAGLKEAKMQYTAIGLCLKECMVPEIPMDDYDIRMDKVFTE